MQTLPGDVEETPDVVCTIEVRISCKRADASERSPIHAKHGSKALPIFGVFSLHMCAAGVLLLTPVGVPSPVRRFRLRLPFFSSTTRSVAPHQAVRRGSPLPLRGRISGLHGAVTSFQYISVCLPGVSGAAVPPREAATIPERRYVHGAISCGSLLQRCVVAGCLPWFITDGHGESPASLAVIVHGVVRLVE